MNIKFNSLFTGINEHIKKKAMIFYGPNIGKIDDCINSVVSLKKNTNKLILFINTLTNSNQVKLKVSSIKTIH